MPCLKPIEAYQYADGGTPVFEKPNNRPARSIRLPCRRCIGCRMDYTFHWTNRGMCELMMHPRGSCHFGTLTYDDDHLPKYGDLVYEDFTRFVKEVRRNVGPFRYMVTAEYGEQTGRPHFHPHIFGLEVPDLVVAGRGSNGDTLFASELLEGLWGKGMVRLGEVTPTTLQYTTGYALKDTGAMHEENYRAVDESTGELVQLRPPFMRVSNKPGIGGEWFDQYGMTDVVPKGFTTHYGKKYPTPPYFVERIKDLDEAAYERVKQERREAAAESERHPDNTPKRRGGRERAMVARKRNLDIDRRPDRV